MAATNMRKFNPLLLLPSLLPILSIYCIPTPSSRCLHHVAYDHPPPSPASPALLQRFLRTYNRTLIHCHQNCTALITAICSNTRPPISLVGRLGPGSDCLRKNMYVITTTQPPPAYFDQKSSLFDFLEDVRGRRNDCRLLHHYDGRGESCADDFDVRERVERIGDRFDEVHDLLDGGDDGLLGEEVWGDVVVEQGKRGLGDVSWLRAEWLLYNALRRINSGRQFCW